MTPAAQAVTDILSSLKLGCRPAEDVPEQDWRQWLAFFRMPTFCPECGRAMVQREGRYGAFLGCTGYPKCEHTEQISVSQRETPQQPWR
jgi:NAD-dependent DNA ligase